MLQHHPSQLSIKEKGLKLGESKHKRYPVIAKNLDGFPGAGMGRIVRFDQAVPLPSIIDRIGLGLGNPKGFPIAVPQGKNAGEIMIRSIGICAGSGGHLFDQMEKNGEDVDLLFTGELSHHEALAAIEKGKCVICLFHSNTERGFLHSVLKGQLETTVREEVCSQTTAVQDVWEVTRLTYRSGTASATRRWQQTVSAARRSRRSKTSTSTSL
jgi:putative NIF3 family GTP cyclohydrolase 1 type 2